jgi:hypothetical protein
MDPRGCNRWQSVASRLAAKAAHMSEKRCRALPPLAAETTWEGGRRRFESVRGITYFLSGPSRVQGRPSWLRPASLKGLSFDSATAAYALQGRCR